MVNKEEVVEALFTRLKGIPSCNYINKEEIDGWRAVLAAVGATGDEPSRPSMSPPRTATEARVRQESEESMFVTVSHEDLAKYILNVCDGRRLHPFVESNDQGVCRLCGCLTESPLHAPHAFSSSPQCP